jgi:HEAT repeat protein
MSFMDLFPRQTADIGHLRITGDIPALIRLLGQSDPHVRVQAAETLGTLGAVAVTALIAALHSPHAPIRLGATEALCSIRDPESVRPLVARLSREKHVELRYAVILALGEIGSPEIIPDLVPLLKDNSKYIRYATAVSLITLGWEPTTENDRIQYLIASQKWGDVWECGAAAVQPLRVVFRDPDPATRIRIASLLGEIGLGEGGTACETGLQDPEPRVRWAAVLAAMNCGIKPSRLPPFVAARERTGPDPVAAAILNFLFFGLGYNYMGKWWGFPVFMTYMCVIVLAQLAMGPLIPYLIVYPVTAVIGVHTYYLARRMSDL